MQGDGRRLVLLFAQFLTRISPATPPASRQRHPRIGRVAPGTGPGGLAGRAVGKEPLNSNHYLGDDLSRAGTSLPRRC
jgi:hypothetical protein